MDALTCKITDASNAFALHLKRIKVCASFFNELAVEERDCYEDDHHCRRSYERRLIH